MVNARAAEVRLELYDLRFRSVTVRSVTDLGPRVRRMTVGGDEMDGFTTAWPDDHLRVYFPDGPGRAPTPPVVTPTTVTADPDAPPPVYRDYTVRAHRPESGEIDLDFVLHADGLASNWASTATVGDPLGLVGPRGSKILRRTFPWYVLAGDETALPALARFAEELPDGSPIQVLVEVTDAVDEQRFPPRPGVWVQWLHRGPAGARRSCSGRCATWSCRRGRATAGRPGRPPCSNRSGGTGATASVCRPDRWRSTATGSRARSTSTTTPCRRTTEPYSSSMSSTSGSSGAIGAAPRARPDPTAPGTSRWSPRACPRSPLPSPPRR